MRAALLKVYHYVARREILQAKLFQHSTELIFAQVSGLIGKFDVKSQLMWRQNSANRQVWPDHFARRVIHSCVRPDGA